MDTFIQALSDWQIFYSTVSLASVTLAGLLFVSLSLRQERTSAEGNSNFTRLARGSFSDFLYILMLGLVFLVPHQAPIGLAVALLVLGLSRFIGLFRVVVSSLHLKSRKTITLNIIREIALPSLASLVLIIVGVEVLRNEMVAVYGLVIVVAALLTTASWNAWIILVSDR